MDEAIAVVDVGATNTRVVLLDAGLHELASRKTPTRHSAGPPYASIDHQHLIGFITSALTELDEVSPIGTISVSAFGATIACLDERGDLVLPVMDYLAEAPTVVDSGYARIAPAFSEVFANTSPGALTLGKQLYWLETEYPDAFSRVRHVLPWSAFIGHSLGGTMASEISNLGVFSHLIDVRTGDWSSLAKSRCWQRLFPERRNAWDVIGSFTETGGSPRLRGRGAILCGIHDSNANWLRYMAGQAGDFTLLSTGTFVIGFDSGADLSGLDPASDTFSFNDIFGKPVGCGRFYGGYEFDRLLNGTAPEAASAKGIRRVIEAGVFALPAFSDTGGPIAGRGKRGRVVGETTDDEMRASLATLYYALMVDRMLEALRSRSTIIVDGPAARNPLLLGLIGALRPGQPVMASDSNEGTTLGAGLLGLMTGTGRVPKWISPLTPCPALRIEAIEEYRARWLDLIAKDQDA
jgi:sugar (pentulose or hexulose) kinase